MKSGLTLPELAKEIKRRQKTKRDFVAPISKLRMAVGRGAPVINVDMGEGKTPGAFGINKIAHEQLADFAGIPMAYYRRMLENDPSLLANNVNRWMKDRDEERRMVRTMDHEMRAILSDKYRPLENEDLADAILPVLLERDLLIMSCQVTDQRLYIKAVDKKILKDVPTGRKMGDGSHVFFDTVSPAITVSNSEVGRGSLLIEHGVFTSACTNLATFGASMRKFHTGTRAELSDEVFALLSDKTKRVTDAAVWSQARDLVNALFDAEKFDAVTKKLAEAVDDKISKKADVVEVVELAGKKLGLGEVEKKGVLQALIDGGDLTRYGLHSAITRYSADIDDYDRATDMERAGAKVIEMPKNDWQQIANAA